MTRSGAFVRKAVAGGDVLFLPSLNCLYLLGLIEYHPKTDAIEYVGLMFPLCASKVA